jgi:hypothetical protein
VRSLTTTIAVLLAVAGIASAVLIHWLTGLFWIEVAVALVVIDGTVGLRAFALGDTNPKRPDSPWPPSRRWIAQVIGASAMGLAVAYLGISAGEPLILLAALMIVLAGYLLWAVPMLKRRQSQHPQH